jgi:hypothetical protein
METVKEPLKAYRFKVKVYSKNELGKVVQSHDLDLMSVCGLESYVSPADHKDLVLTKAVMPGDTVLYDWNKSAQVRSLEITVDSLFTIVVENVKPKVLRYSDLDAGADFKYLFLESLTLDYNGVKITSKEI